MTVSDMEGFVIFGRMPLSSKMFTWGQVWAT